MNFEFATATKIIFGNGSLKQTTAVAQEFGNSCLVVTGKNKDRNSSLIDQLKSRDITLDCLSICNEPTIDNVKRGALHANDINAEMIVGIGGGSVIDAAKAIAALATNTNDPLTYLEVIGEGKPLTVEPLPYIAIPTTAGTGAEVTKNSVLTSPENKVKVSLRHPSMLPNVAIIDPELTYSTPRHITASTGLDTLTQLIEPFVSCVANPLTDSLCREGIIQVARSLRTVCADLNNTDAREDMALASLFGGLALANAKLGAVHGISGPLGGMIDAPHGELCAALLPSVTEINIKTLQKSESNNHTLAKYETIAKILLGDDKSTVNELIDYLFQLVDDLDIPSLSKHGFKTSDFHELVGKAKRASSMKGNPIVLSDDDLNQILDKAL